MKTKLFLFLLLVLPFLNSCKKSADNELSFTKLTVEQQKQKIEDNGVNFLNTVQKLETTPAYSVIENFVNLTNSMQAGAPLAQNLKRAIAQRNVKPLQKTIIPQENWGKYEWDFINNEFNQTATYSTEKVVFLFPSTENGTQNNAELTFNWVDSNVPMPDETEMYFPSSITTVLKVDGTTLLDQNFAATFVDDYPSSVTESLIVDKFNFNSTFTHSDKNVASGMTFKYDDTNLIGYEVKTDGTYDKASLDNIEDGNLDIIENANVKFNVMNIGIVGSIADFKGMADAVQKLEANENLTEEQYAQQSVDILNKYVKMFGYFVDENKKFADVEFYVESVTDTYQEGYWDEATQTWKYRNVTETYMESMPRFVLSDGSKVKIEDYFQQGFEDFQTKLTEILEGYGIVVE